MKANDKSRIEEWRAVPGFCDYEISSCGRLRSYKKGKCALLSPHKAQDGYLVTALTSDTGKIKNFRIHTLVALAFIGPPPPNHQVHHQDNNKTNNFRENIIYKDSFTHLSEHFCTFSREEIAEIRNLYLNHANNLNELAAIIGANPITIRRYVADLMD